MTTVCKSCYQSVPETEVAQDAYEYFLTIDYDYNHNDVKYDYNDNASISSFVTSCGGLVDLVRLNIIAKLHSQPIKFDKYDFEMLVNDDNYLSILIEEQSQLYLDEDKIIAGCVEYVITCLKWRTSYGVNQLTIERFPVEGWRSGIVSTFLSPDPSKDNVVYVNIGKYYIINKEFSALIVKWIICCTEEMVKRTRTGQRIQIVMDTSTLGFYNADLSLALSLAPMWLTYYPIIENYFLIGSNFVIRGALKVVLRVLTAHQQRKIQFVEPSQLVRDYGSAAVPAFLGGSGLSVTNMSFMAKNLNCDTLEDIAKQHNLKGVDKFKTMLLKSMQ
ncbi:hypothetical protein HDE_09236 [Halotydeus destructor]|nr:hypothetical protein HDE_09236 [Halotydeus destructor]